MPEFPIFEASELEIRRSGQSRVLRGRFNYGSMATVRDRGRVRKERFEPRAFRFAIEDETRQLDILVGHDFGKPIASRKAGTLEIAFADATDEEPEPQLIVASGMLATSRPFSIQLWE